ncbi:MAG: SpvB/TcaC N-terminal domain-containing protein, partial [Mangrovibacterium sp.]
MKQKLSYKIFAWLFICIMMSQSCFAYGMPNKPSGEEVHDSTSAQIYDSTTLTIGLWGDNQFDNPADNYTEVELYEELTANSELYLVYELEGISHHSGVTRRINDELALGGRWVQLSRTNKIQRERINPQTVKQGMNKVYFGQCADADYGYRVRNVRFELQEKAIASPSVFFSAQKNADRIYLQGFSTQEDAQIKVGQTTIPTHHGNFEAELNVGESQTLTLLHADGSEEHFPITAQQVRLDYQHELEPFGESRMVYFEVKQNNALSLDGAELLAGEQITQSDKDISLTTLRHADMPALDMGLNNVTKQARGYRFLPHGEHFSDSGAVVKLAYDKLNLPSGYTEKDIQAYYFDEATGHWASLQIDSIDTQNGVIYARTTHFTDMIAGVITAPESPETAGFTPTMMTGIQAANPTAKVGMIAAPSANNRGSAGMSYSLEMPPARNGMSPNVSISYNSDGGSGWLGEGWDVSIPSISVETRWGVPRYNPSEETETYLM